MTKQPKARFSVLALLLCYLAFVDAQPPNLIELYDGKGAAGVPGSSRIPSLFTSYTPSGSTEATYIASIDDNFMVTSTPGANLGEYNCQIFTFEVNNVSSSCLDVGSNFHYFGLEGGIAYTTSGGTTYTPPVPDLFISTWNPHTHKYDLVATFTTNSSSPNGYHDSCADYTHTLYYNSTYFWPTATNSCAVTYGVCGLTFSDTSTPLVYSWQGDALGYVYLGELGVGFLTPLPRSWEDAPNYFAATPTWPDGYYVFDESAFVPIERNGVSVWELQYCEEKEEFSFTDSIELWYVDTPAGVSIFSDFHLTPNLYGVYDSDISDVTSCVDQDGSDCLGQLRSFDGNEWVTSSVVTPSYVEVGLGVTETPTDLKMLLSMRFFKNFQTWRMGPHNSKRAMELQQLVNGVWEPVPDAYSLSWKGADRVIFNTTDFDRNTRVVDLTGMPFFQSAGEELKLRLAFYWQDLPIKVDRIQFDFQAGYSVPSPTVLKPIYADLHFRGASANGRKAAANLIPAPTYTPVELKGIPLDMSGDLSPYGDVLSLLLAKDDEYVIMSTGDEMTLRFTAPNSGPADGLVRSVIFSSRCWYKAEGKATGRTTEPLPWFSMPKYPYDPAGTPVYDTTQHSAFLAGLTRVVVAEVDHFSLRTDEATLTTFFAYPVNTTTTTTSTTSTTSTTTGGAFVSAVTMLSPSSSVVFVLVGVVSFVVAFLM